MNPISKFFLDCRQKTIPFWFVLCFSLIFTLPFGMPTSLSFAQDATELPPPNKSFQNLPTLGSSPLVSLRDLNPLDLMKISLFPVLPTPLDQLQPGDQIILQMVATVPEGAHTSSMNPKVVGATFVRLKQVKGLEEVDPSFLANKKPKAYFDDDIQEPIEEFTGRIIWRKRFRLLPNVSVQDVQIQGEYDWQICNERSCMPFKKQTLDVKLTENPEGKPIPFPSTTSASSAGTKPQTTTDSQSKTDWETRPTYLDQPGPVVLRTELLPVPDNQPADYQLKITLELDKGWHVYALSQLPENAAIPAEIKLTQLNGLSLKDGKLQASKGYEAVETPSEVGTLKHRLYHDEITWILNLMRNEIDSTTVGLAGSLRYQVCEGKNRCLTPQTVKFVLGEIKAGVSQTYELSPAEYADEEFLATLEYESGGENRSLLWYLITGFLGGLFLNVMPCVLPVISIKALSLVKQAGESRRRILILNIVYALGVLVVFWVLASLVAFVGMSWGGLFQRTWFNLFMVALVFSMGLSLLGYFEISMPGFTKFQ